MSHIYFIYDGECPLCFYAAQALRVKQSVGTLHLINARDPVNVSWVNQVNEAELDLDEGMAIFYAERFYHGKDALHLMGLLATDSGWFNKVNAFLFRSKRIANLCYPLMRFVRNALIKAKGISKIDNLHRHTKHATSNKESSVFSIRRSIQLIFIAITACAASVLLISALSQWQSGSKTAIESYSLCVALPAILIAILSCMKGTKTKEGLFMRVGLMTHLLLIILLPDFALHLALGFPVVFLIVELLTTKLPAKLYHSIEKTIIK